MSTATTTNGGLKGTFTEKCLKIIGAASRVDDIEIVWVASRGEAKANVAERYIKTPWPASPADMGCFLHEFGHFIYGDTGERGGGLAAGVPSSRLCGPRI